METLDFTFQRKQYVAFRNKKQTSLADLKVTIDNDEKGKHLFITMSKKTNFGKRFRMNVLAF